MLPPPLGLGRTVGKAGNLWLAILLAIALPGCTTSDRANRTNRQIVAALGAGDLSKILSRMKNPPNAPEQASLLAAGRKAGPCGTFEDVLASARLGASEGRTVATCRNGRFTVFTKVTSDGNIERWNVDYKAGP